MDQALQITKHGMTVGLLVVALCLNSGCCTRTVWQDTAAKTWTPVNRPPIVWTTVNGQDVLVAFHQQELIGDKLKERPIAVWMSSWPKPAAVGKRPLRRLTNSVPPLIPLAVFMGQEPTESDVLEEADHAVWDSSRAELSILLRDQVIGPMELPITREDRKTAARVIGTPLAVVGDAVIVAGIITAIGLSGGVQP